MARVSVRELFKRISIMLSTGTKYGCRAELDVYQHEKPEAVCMFPSLTQGYG